ncbi:MAG TPA: putative baseplate assembly protein [Pyrinomonadaceae bacterium]|nr:putative baseplate assembly protein [Pyrinomonadaceae bacterium]
MASEPLCKLPPPPPPGCCDEPPRPPAAPIRPFNSPGLSSIRYRIGTFSSFRRAMLDAVPLVKVPKDTRVTPPLERANPFARWHEGMGGDYHTMLIELWAYLADILTFYQERIANEAYLSTATQRESLRRLAQLIGYQPQPGSAATALLNFTIEKQKTVTIPAGFRAGSKAKPGKQAAVFETEDAIVALGSHSAIPLSMVAPTNQFAALSDYGLVLAAGPSLTTAAAASNIYGLAGAAYLQTFLFDSAINEAVSSFEEAASISAEVSAESSLLGLSATGPFFSVAATPLIFATTFLSGLYVSKNTRQVVLQGTSTRLEVGDYVLVVENAGASGEKATLRQISTVKADKESSTTIITWPEETGASYQNVTLQALRVTAAPFGSNAPSWISLPATLTNSDDKHPEAPDIFQDNWDDPNEDRAHVPSANKLSLDGTYDDAKGTPDNPGWVVMLSDNPVIAPFIAHVVDARPFTAVDYTITSKVTRLTLKAGETVPEKTFPLRSTVVLTGNEPLALQNNLPLPDPLSGSKLILDGLYPQLTAGQTVVLQGTLHDPDANPPTAITNAEAAILAEAPIIDTANNITTVTLKTPLAEKYVRAGAVLLANIVEATQGETVKDEILGSGNGAAFQTFKLKKSPLTYLPAEDAEGLSAVESTLLVTVNGVRWKERPTLFDSPPDGQDFTAVQDDDEKTIVTFGDGVFGARPPTGKDNIHARYRKGIGVSGNVEIGGIQQLIDSSPGVQKVTNPQAAFGGADRESVDKVRTNASASLSTFGRAVSAADYAALAISYPGVAKASAAWVNRDWTTLKALDHPYIQLVVATADQQPLAEQPTFAAKLRSFLDQRRDPNVSLRITDFIPVYIEVVASVEIDDAFPQQATIAKVQAALNTAVNPDGTIGFFAFEGLSFGESIHLSAVYAQLQSVPGVKDALVTTLRRLDTDTDPTKVRDSIFIRPTELAVIRNDPAKPNEGTLTITGSGGFIDT